MSFAENLRKLRKDKQLSQEKLAEMLDVSRQAVSKWEQGIGYPEAEKLLLLSDLLDISLDDLMSTDKSAKIKYWNQSSSGTILIYSPLENVIVSCYKVVSSGKMLGGKTTPKFALFGVSLGGSSFWGEPTTFLGWYENKDEISREIAEIQFAMTQRVSAYTLKYNVKTTRHWGKIRIVKD